MLTNSPAPCDRQWIARLVDHDVGVCVLEVANEAGRLPKYDTWEMAAIAGNLLKGEKE